MSDWYKMHPVDWNEGTDDLSLEQEAAYLRICHAMYVTGKPVADNKFIVAGLLRCNDRKASRLLDELVQAGKLTRDCGCITNRRALEEISNRDRVSVERKSAGSRGGVESANARSKALENNKHGQAIAQTLFEADKIREDKTEKEETSVSLKKRASRLPDNWQPDQQFAIKEGLTELEATREVARFRDYWLSKGGAAATKIDWDGTWRNWVRKVADDRRNQLAKRRPTAPTYFGNDTRI